MRYPKYWLLILGLAASTLARVGVAGVASPTSASPIELGGDVRPGARNPIQNPSRYTLFADDEVFLPALENLYAVDVGLTPEDASLKSWKESANDSEHCRSAARRFTRGRIVTPLRDQLVCATGARVEILEPHAVYNLPEAGVSVGRPVSVAAGDLDRVVAGDGFFHDEIAVTYPLNDGRLRLLILSWKLEPLASWDSPAPSRGDAAVAMADLNGDGKMDLALAAGDADPRAYQPGNYGKYPGTLTLRTFRFTRDGDQFALNPVDETAMQADAAYSSVNLQPGDYDGDSEGTDELLLGYYLLKPEPPPLALALYSCDGADLRLKAGGTTSAGSPRPGSYFSMTAGLLHFNPQKDYNVQRRQPAIVWADKSGSVKVSVYDVESLERIRERGSLDLGKVGAAPQIGPGITAGNFVGQRNVDSPRMQLAVRIPVPVQGRPETYPRFVVLEVDNDDFSLSKITEVKFDRYRSSGLMWSQELISYDQDGDSYFLGAPIHATVDQVLDTKYVIQEPPKHIDCFPRQGGVCEPENVSASSEFFVELSDEEQQTLKQTSRDTTSWDIGGSVALSSSQTVKGGYGDIASAELTRSQKVALSFDYSEVTEKINSVYEAVHVQRTDRTTGDDHVIFNVRMFDIWRYPVYGLTVGGDSKLQGFYELILPGPKVEVDSAASIHEWYQPRHQNKNVLSYPRIGAGFPQSVGSFTPKDGETVTGWLNEPITRFWDPNSQTYRIEWTKQAGSSSEKTYTTTLKENVDLSFSSQASVDLFVSASGSATFDFSFHNSNSWQNNTIAEESISSTRGISLQNPPEGSAHQAYAFQTAAYITQNGTFRVAHAVDPTGARSGAQWWREHYSHAPDPAVNLPNRFTYSEREQKWNLTPEPQRWQMRGFFLRKAVKNPVTDTYDELSRAVEQGELVRVGARVHNFSLAPAPVSFATRFEYAEVDPNTGEVVGERKPIATAEATLGPQESKEVAVEWNTAGLGGGDPGTARYYRFFVTADPENEIRGEIHEGPVRMGGEIPEDSDNFGFWPWDSGFKVFRPAIRQAEPAAFDLSAAPGGLEVQNAEDESSPYRLHAVFHATQADLGYRLVLFYDGDPEAGGKVIAGRSLKGVVEGENHVWADWRPESPGLRHLFVRAIESSRDVRPGNAVAGLEVRVDPK